MTMNLKIEKHPKISGSFRGFSSILEVHGSFVHPKKNLRGFVKFTLDWERERESTHSEMGRVAIVDERSLGKVAEVECSSIVEKVQILGVLVLEN